MKRTLSSVIAASVILVCSTPSFAGPATEKFKGGLKTVITAPVQVSYSLDTETKNAKFFPFAFVGGFFKGVFYMGKNIVTGTLDMVTSPLEAVKK